MVAATGQAVHQEPYVPLPEGFVNVPYNDVGAIMKATGPDTCAVMLEPIQGEGGVIIPDDDYLKKVRAWCDEKGILLILDEVQTGIGRIGALFGHQVYGVEPDIMALAKGLVALGAFLAKEKASVFAPGEHGSTFGGNPLACAAGYAALKFIIDHDVPGNARETGAYLMAELDKLKAKFDYIVDVRGRGLLVAVQMNRDLSDAIVRACLERGFLLNMVKPNVIRLIPALNITKSDVDEAMGILEPVMAEVGSR
jgi:acetylornithine/succinyldiaminopimelate/putrescine aminotransferase